MQNLITHGHFPHSSLFSKTDYAEALLRSNSQHTLALLRHLSDCLNYPVNRRIETSESLYEDPQSRFGISELDDPDGCDWCGWLMCLSIVCIPCACYVGSRGLKRRRERIFTAREFNKRMLLKQYDVMLSLLECN